MDLYVCMFVRANPRSQHLLIYAYFLYNFRSVLDFFFIPLVPRCAYVFVVSFCDMPSTFHAKLLIRVVYA
jgi:hypothetical protein